MDARLPLLVLVSAVAIAQAWISAAPMRARRRTPLALTAVSHTVDVAVVGGGIGGSTISWLLQEQQQCTVALIDPRVNVRGTWYPNYGAWRSEWHCLSERLKLPELKECTTTEWEYTDCFLGGSFDVPINERLQLPNPYVSTQRTHFAPYLVLRTNPLTHKHTTHVPPCIWPQLCARGPREITGRAADTLRGRWRRGHSVQGDGDTDQCQFV